MRYAHNPILSPEDLCPSQPSMQIECLLNPGVFRYDGKVWMLVRVAERPAQAEGEVSFPLLDAQNRVTVMRVPAASPNSTSRIRGSSITRARISSRRCPTCGW